MSNRVVLLGHPVVHSLSEALQNAAFQALDVDAVYEPIDTTVMELPAAVEALRGDEFLGANVTLPHRERVVPLVDRVTDEAQATGAVDTITCDGDQLVGHNTDVLGFRPALDKLVGKNKMPKTAVVLGAGGGARAVVYAFISAGFHSVIVFNRHLHRGERLVKHFGRSASHMELRAKPWHESVIEAELAKTDILVNASSVGRDPQESPLPAELLPPDLRVLDLHYVPKETRLLKEAKAAGATEAQNGDVMLLNQSAAAFELWTGEKAPMDVLKKQLDASRDAPEIPVETAAGVSDDESGADAGAETGA